MTVDAVAAELGVSRRTLFRDIALLRERGIPVEADRGRGGGIRLHRNWGVGRLTLNYREAVDLLVSIAIAEQLRSPWMLTNLAPVRRKLTASFSPSVRPSIEALKSRILIGPNASAPVLVSFGQLDDSVADTLCRAFFERRVLTFGYRDGSNNKSHRWVEPQLLVLNYPVWYLLTWDLKRDGVRYFRCDRMFDAEIQNEKFQVRPRATFEQAIEGSGAVTP